MAEVNDEKNSASKPITGECFCGSVTYRIDGDLRDARSCHCSRCRKAFNAQASAYAQVDADKFRWLTGEELLNSYVGEQGFGLQFCSRCGSTLCGIFNGELHGVTLGCINGDPPIELITHLYVGSKASWETIPATAVQYDESWPTQK